MLSEEIRARTLARFEEHRRAWDANPALRGLYADWYSRVARALPPETLGERVELGSGPGFSRSFIPALVLTDLVKAPWHDREVSADTLPYGDGSLGALVLFDVLHHLPAPGRFFAEATRVLRIGGRAVMREPYVGPLSYPVYKFLHDEALDMGVDPFRRARGNRAGPLRFEPSHPDVALRPQPCRLSRAFPGLTLQCLEYLSGPATPRLADSDETTSAVAPLESLAQRGRTLPNHGSA